MASLTDTDIQQAVAEHIFKLLKEQAGLDSATDKADFEQVIDKMRLVIEGGTAARGGTDSPQLTNALREKLFDFGSDVRQFFGGLNVTPLPPPDPQAAQSAAAAEKTQREANTSSVPAFDRPQSVIIVGPRPLPVTVVGGSSGGGDAQAKDASSFNFENVAKGVQLLSIGLSTLSHSLRTAVVTTDALIDVTQAYVGAIGKINSAVELFDPGTAYLFSEAARNMSAAIGRLLVPAIQQATMVINLVNAAFSRFGPESKTLISAMAGASAIMVTLGVAVGATTALLFGLAGALTAVGIAIDIAGAGIPAIFGAIGAAITAVGVTATAAGAGLATFTALTSDTNRLLQAVAPILNAVINSFERLSPRLLEISERIAPVVVLAVEIAASFAEMSIAIMSAKGALELMAVAAAIAAIPFILMLSPLILLAAAAAAATVAIYALLRALGLIEDIKIDKKKEGITYAATPASFGSAQSMAEKTYASAYSLGTAETNPLISSNANLLGGVRGLTGKIDDLIKQIVLWINAVVSVFSKPGDVIREGVDNAKNQFRDFLPPLFTGGFGGIFGLKR